MPSSVESYYQEIGRAGRDGLPADTLSLYSLDDMAFRRRWIDEKDVSDERRHSEHERFSALANLCESPRCRRQTLLAYFAEDAAPCGRCDVCQGKVAVFDGAIAAQKALSAVYRTGQRFGSTHLAHVLVGEATDALRRHGHDAIKTFGVGKEHSKDEWSSILRQLFAAGALRTASAEHGGFALTPKGVEILYGRETILLRSDPLTPRERRRKEAPTLDEATDRILSALKRKRRALAQEEGVPAYVIFAARTLLDMAEKRPATLDEMLQVHGVGERKVARYADAFLEALNEALG
jgi:ATP-dependent DNA helicase RecQ